MTEKHLEPESKSSEQDQKTPPDKPKRSRGRPVVKPYPERIDATPEEIAEVVLGMPAKKPDEWRYLNN